MPLVGQKIAAAGVALAATVALIVTLVSRPPARPTPGSQPRGTSASRAVLGTVPPSSSEESGMQAMDARPGAGRRTTSQARPKPRGRGRQPLLPAPSARSSVVTVARPEHAPRLPVKAQTEPQPAPGGGPLGASPGEQATTSAGMEGVTPPAAPLGAPPSPPDPAPPAARAAEPVVTPPIPLTLTPPRHPMPYQMVVDVSGIASTARLKGVEARVRLRLLVRADGTVGRAEVAVPSGHPELDAAALAAALTWRFLPARRDGEPIESVALIWVAFTSTP